jgi:hypothetical protein
MKSKLILLGLVFLFSFWCRNSPADSDIEKIKKNAEKGDANAQYIFGLMYSCGAQESAVEITV